MLDYLKLASRILSVSHTAISTSADEYYGALATLCQSTTFDGDSSTLISDAFSKPLVRITNQGQYRISAQSNVKIKSCDNRSNMVLESLRPIYHAIAFQFLCRPRVSFFETNLTLFSEHINIDQLALAILDGYGKPRKNASNEDMLWLVSHFVSLGNVAQEPVSKVAYLETLYIQLTALSREISLRLDSESSQGLVGNSEHTPDSEVIHPFIKHQLLSLVSPKAISELLRDLSRNMDSSSSRQFQETSLLAGYISTLLVCFPSQADEIRMRLFLESTPTPAGEITTVTLFWRTVRQSALFHKLSTESQSPDEVLRDYAQGDFHPSASSPEEQQWKVAIIFLELYIFVLRLSDDEDFFSGLKPQLIARNSPASRIQACNLSLEDLKLLTTFLKNTAFALHYKGHQLSQTHLEANIMANSRLGSYLGSSSQSTSGPTRSRPSDAMSTPSFSTKLGIASLREIITTAMKMLYERDSRKPFLPTGHWLMTHKLDRDDFVSAVIAEDERQRQEDDEHDTDDEDEDMELSGLRPTSLGMTSSSRSVYNAGLERVRHYQRKMQKQRRLAEMGPKLEILKHMPFVVPFETRVKIFRQFINLDRFRREQLFPRSLHSMMDGFPSMSARHHADIRRGQLFEDAYENFYKLGDGLKDPISITFVDQFGSPEAGIDGGGVTKEFLTSVTTEAFSGSDDVLHMFTSSGTGLLYPNPVAVDNIRESLRRQRLSEGDAQWRDTIAALLRRYEFLGRIIGKCLYEGILVDLAFAGFFLLQWPSAGSNEGNTYKGSVNDLSDMDEDLYKGMLRLKNYAGDVSDLGIDFTITDQVSAPNEPVQTVTRNLMPNGDKMLVTNDNRPLYISYVARHRLVLQPALQTSAFLRGLRTIIRPSWLSMFNQSELQRLVGGDSSEIDVEDLRQNTVYGGLYEIGDDRQEHPTIKLFWTVMKSFNDSQRRDVLKYVSSTPRAPLLGFSQLRPKFSIRDAGTNERRLPSTSTCVNLLKLPQYKTEATLREKLLYAVTSGAGFDLS